MTALRVGAASRVLTPEVGRAMAGYAARRGPATAVVDDLYCQAVVLRDGDTTVALAVCDLLYVTGPLTAAVRAELSSRLGVPGQHVMLAATHTHCGPAGLGSTPDDESLRERLVAGIVDAVADAADAAVPARLVAGRTHVPGVACNRRDPDGPVDDVVRVVTALPVDGDDAIAVLVNFACHATVLDHETCAYSADYPGAVRRAVESLCGGHAIFLQGCAGDVNPAFAAQTPAEARRVGHVVGAAAAECALRLSWLGRDRRTINLSRREQLAVPGSVDGDVVHPAPLSAAEEEIVATVRVRPDLEQVRREQADVTTGPRAVELWIEELFAAEPWHFASMDRPPGDTAALPVQMLRLGADLAVVGLPGEPFTATAAAIRDATSSTVLVAGYANLAAGYLPTREEFERSGYEVGSTQYVPGTAEELAEAAVRLLAGARET
ncbi:MAG: hypothetical protein GEV10_03495 [Streptosporangiales bacterium]|nr:hypothetical protein [Streptosporangiales bacterium]